MKINGIPDGWELVRFGSMEKGEWYIEGDGEPREWQYTHKSIDRNYIIITRIEPVGPGEGFRFIDFKGDTRRSSDEYWSDSRKRWVMSDSTEFADEMIYRRRIELESKYIPWTRETCPLGGVVSDSLGDFVIISKWNDGCASSGFVFKYYELLKTDWTHNGKPCGTEVIRTG